MSSPIQRLPRFANPATNAEHEARAAAAQAVRASLHVERGLSSVAAINAKLAAERSDEADDVAYARAEYDRLSREAEQEPFLTEEHRAALVGFAEGLAGLEGELLASRARVKERDEECNRLAAYLRRAGVNVPDRSVAGPRHTAAMKEIGDVLYAAAGPRWRDLAATLQRIATILPRRPR